MDTGKGKRRNKDTSLDDILGDLLADDVPSKPSSQASSKSKGGKNSQKDDDFYSNLAAMADNNLDSDVSEADVNQVAKSIADLDDMDADLFGGSSKKNGGKGRSGKATTPRRSSLTPRSRGGTPRSGKPGSPRRSGDSSPPPKQPPPKSPSSPTHQAKYKPGTAPGKMTDLGRESENLRPGQTLKPELERPQTVPKAKPKVDFGDFDEDDPLAGLLSDEESEIEKNKPSLKSALKYQSSNEDLFSPPESSPVNTQTKQATSVSSTPSIFDRPPTRSGAGTNDTEPKIESKPKPVVKKREERLFSDDEDMLDGLGIDDTPKPTTSLSVSKEREDEVRPARNVLDSLLGKDTVNKHLQKSERKEFIFDKKVLDKDKAEDEEDDLIFGDYRPSSVGGSRPTSRRSVRFQDDDIFGTDDKPPSRGRSDPGKSKAADDMDWLELASGNRTSIDTPKVSEKKALKFTPKSGPSDWLGLKGSSSDNEDDDMFKSSSKPTTPSSKTHGKTDNTAIGLSRHSNNDDWLEKLKAMNDDANDEAEEQVTKREITLPSKEKEVKEDGNDYLGLGKEINLDDLISGKPESPTFPGKKSVAEDSIFQTPVKVEDSVDASFRRRRILLDDDDDIFPGKESKPSIPNDDFNFPNQTPDYQDIDSNPHFKKTPQSQISRHAQPQPEASVIQTTVFPSRDPEVQNLRNISTPPTTANTTTNVPPPNQFLSASHSVSYQQQPYSTTTYQQQPQIQYQPVQTVNQPMYQSSPQPLHLPNSVPESHAMIRKLDIEKQYTDSLLDGTKRRYEEEIIAVETSFRNRLRILEESHQKKEIRLREENEQLMEQHLGRIRQVEEEKADQANQNYRKLEELERQRAKDVENVKEQHRTSFNELKREHEEAIDRLKEAKNREINAVANANDTSRSLTAVVEQIQTSTKDLGSLQSQVESIHRSGLDEREISLKAKDAQLHSLQERLTRQEDDNERERKRLEDLIARMETQMREQTRLLDEEKWKMKGEMSRLEANQRSLEEEKRINLESQARERGALERARDNFQEENRVSLGQLNNERRALAEERMKWNVDLKLHREQSHQDAIKTAQSEAEYEVLTKTIAEEKARSSTRRQELKQEEDRIINERARLEREKYDIDNEKQQIEKLALQLKTKSTEIDSITEMANRTQNDGDRSLIEARSVESQQNQRLSNIQQQLQQLKLMEENMAQEKLKMSKDKHELENLRNSALCVNCRSPLNGAVQNNAGQIANTSQLMMSSPVQGMHAGRYSSVMANGIGGGHLSVNAIETITSSIASDRSIRMWKIQALKDKDYLEEESMFLEALKHSPYHNNHSFH